MHEIPFEDLNDFRLLEKEHLNDVYLAKCSKFGEVMVIKTFFQGDNTTFTNLIDHWSKLSSSYLPLVLGTTNNMEGFFIITEYLPNGSLFDFVEKACSNEQEFPWSQRLKIAHDIASGLLFLLSHGIELFDLKSNHVHLDNNMNAKISLLAYSKIISNDIPMLWMASEVSSKRFDDCLESLGVIFMELATLQHHHEMSLDSLPSSCPVLFSNMIEDCWIIEKKPNTLSSILERLSSLMVDDGRNKIDFIENQTTMTPSSTIDYEKWKTIKDYNFDGDIFNACSSGKLTSVIYLLANGIDVNVRHSTIRYKYMDTHPCILL